jgi:hypothetical protein
MIGGTKEYTAGSNVKDPTTCLLSSWSEILSDTIIKVFKKCVISNAMDETRNTKKDIVTSTLNNSIT